MLTQPTSFQYLRAKESKKCLYCAELIKKDATKCKHCGADLPSLA
ncbi:MAG: zinc ribbon domain-containing protein [Methylophilaceae bacterium]